jgi:hypothetical protein
LFARTHVEDFMTLTLDTPTSAVCIEALRQRRVTRRRPLHADVDVIAPQSGRGVTINVSEGGLRIAVDCTLRVDDVCMLVIREPNQPVRLERARVVWARTVRDGCVAGLAVAGLH